MMSVSAITAIAAMLAGVVTVAIPTIAEDIRLDQSLLLWPASIYALVSGCTLLIAGRATDILVSRLMYLTRCLVQCSSVLACGLARTGPQMIVFRGFSGLANSICLPSAVKISTNALSTGKRRKYAFAAMGAGQPLGVAIGLTIRGVLTGTIGWRWSFHLVSILTVAVGVVAAFAEPKDERDSQSVSWVSLRKDVDWVGATLASISLAELSYVMG